VHYIARASGEGSAGPQVQPWDYYFRVLFAGGGSTGPIFNELTIALLALVGLVAAALGRALDPGHLYAARFVAVYTVLMAVVYSAVPYKTPWSVLGMLQGMILLAGVGAAALLYAAPWRWLKGAVIAVLAISAVHLAWQSYRTNFVFQAGPDNPYAHTPTHPSALRLCEKVRDVAAVHPDGRAMPVQLICPDHDYWPLPWYLRGMTRVGGYSGMPEGPAAPLIVTRPELGRLLGRVRDIASAGLPGPAPLAPRLRRVRRVRRVRRASRARRPPGLRRGLSLRSARAAVVVRGEGAHRDAEYPRSGEFPQAPVDRLLDVAPRRGEGERPVPAGPAGGVLLELGDRALDEVQPRQVELVHLVEDEPVPLGAVGRAAEAVLVLDYVGGQPTDERLLQPPEHLERFRVEVPVALAHAPSSARRRGREHLRPLVARCQGSIVFVRLRPQGAAAGRTRRY
jgi:hypothetical protein